MLSSKNVIFLASCQGCGLTYHNVQCLLSMKKQAKERNFHLQVVTVSKQQNSGLIDLLQSSFSQEDLHIIADLRHSLKICVGKLLEKCGGAIVQAQGLNNVLMLRNLKMKYGKNMPMVVITHSFRVQDRLQRFISSFIQSLVYQRYVDYTIFQSSETADIFCGSSRLLKGKHAGFIPLGLEADMATNVQEPDVSIGDPDLRVFVREAETCTFVYLANFSKNKGHSWILKAITDPLLRNSAVRFIFLGDGEEKEPVRQQVMKLGLSEQVILPGRIDRKWVPWLLSQCQVAIVGSQCETFGHNFLEPMMLGIPVIGTPTGIGKSLLMDYLTGFCVLAGDVPGFRRAVEYMIAHPLESREMGANARQMVKRWTWDEIGAAYYRLYDDLLCRST